MPRIKILHTDLQNKIAAGEVIERPMSVVKELIENSIDAGSTNISVEILGGGRHMIKVSDNGEGMDRHDAAVAFRRHATSKIEKEEDLFNIKTLGFRGEALPSIASVSKVRIVTGIKKQGGISLEIAGGEVADVRESPHHKGTSIEVRDLFYNTPARKKFLKSNATEVFHITDAVTKSAISHPGTGFRLNVDGRETLDIPPASGIRERLLQIFGPEFLFGTIEAIHRSADMAIKAFVSRPHKFRNSRTNQYIFVNTRPVRDISVSHAVYAAYQGMIPKNCHPIFFVFLEINPARVDFNVHPSKVEIRFEDKESVHRFVRSSIKDALAGEHHLHTGMVPETTEETDRAAYTGYNDSDNVPEADVKTFVSENLEFPYRPSVPCIFLGDTFVAFSGSGGLSVLDHHAAHERVLFEKLLKDARPASKQLLFPQQVRLPERDYSLLLENLEVIRSLGIEAEDFGQGTLIVRAVPEEIDESDMQGILADIAAGISEGRSSFNSARENLAAKVACHRSVRGRKILSTEEFSRLLDDLEKTENPDHCPHGRPTRIYFSLDDLKRLFKRK